MRPLRIVVVLLAVGLMASPVAGQQDQIDRIDLPDGWAPEGITTLDGKLYVGSLADGAIWVVDPADPSSGRVFAEGEDGRVTVGVEAALGGDTIWAAGGRTGEIRAYDVNTGEFGMWGFGPGSGPGFFNDMAATEEAVHVTDSFVPRLLTLPVPSEEEAQRRGPAPTFERISLSGDLEYVDGAFNVNGIVAAPAGLVVVQSTPGTLFRVDPETGESFRIDSGNVELSGGDGLELDGDILYVVRNSANVVTALRLDDSLTTASLVAELRHPDLDTPTTAALIDHDLWVVSARFGAPAGPETEYWLTRLDAAGGADD